jgi:septum formation protein
LAADTTVTLDGRLLGKPRDAVEAGEMLQRLSGRDHQVWTAVALAGTLTTVLAVETQVTFRVLSDKERAWYVASGEPLGKAGAYAIQGLAAAFITGIVGSYTNVVGLPLPESLSLLAAAGVPLPWSRP